jgi:Anti-sigma factor NepR
MKQVQAAIGRRLKEEYDSVQPLPDRLSDLLRKIEEATKQWRPVPTRLKAFFRPITRNLRSRWEKPSSTRTAKSLVELRCAVGVMTGHPMTSKADEYRAKALECEQRAEQTHDAFIKAQLIGIAEKWRTMAAHDERYGR